MLIHNIYIISWFGDNPSLRNYRKSKHQEQLKTILSFGIKFNIVILAQQYEETDYYIHPDITYIKSEEVKRPNLARNILKKHFYDTTEDYALFLDDDVILTQEYIQLLAVYEQNIRTAFNDYKIGTISVQYGLGNYSLRKDNSLIYINKMYRMEHKNPVLYLADKACPEALYIMRNFKKLDNKEFYYDEDIKFSMGKDLQCSLLKEGFKTYYFWNMNNNFENNTKPNSSTIAGFRNNYRDKDGDFYKARKRFFDKWSPELNIKISKDYTVQDIRNVLLGMQEKYVNLNEQPYKIVLTKQKNIGILLKEIK